MCTNFKQGTPAEVDEHIKLWSREIKKKWPVTLVRSNIYRDQEIYTYMYIAYVLWRLKHNIYVHIHCRNIYSRYSKPCLIQHLCYPLPCVIRCWFLCPFNSFSMCLTLCIVIRHPVYLTQNFSPSAAVIGRNIADTA